MDQPWKSEWHVHGNRVDRWYSGGLSGYQTPEHGAVLGLPRGGRDAFLVFLFPQVDGFMGQSADLVFFRRRSSAAPIYRNGCNQQVPGLYHGTFVILRVVRGFE